MNKDLQIILLLAIWDWNPLVAMESPHTGPEVRKVFPSHDVVMVYIL